ncbi:hypothetical protein BKI52_06330 [marine bacterium AO1-C]|nr:hypothetical protein BKI52_06330 [marine bacterium AO1-C]
MIRKLLLAVTVMIGCWQCKPQSSAKKSTANDKQTLLLKPIARGTIRVIAQVVKVKPINKTLQNTPCADHPCEAMIKIEKVVGTGAFFYGEIKQGQSLEAYFTKTLASSEKNYPQLKPALPGLNLNDRFQADIIYNLKATKVSKYHVVTYKKL